MSFNQLLGRKDSYSALVGAGFPDPFEGVVERLQLDFNCLAFNQLLGRRDSYSALVGAGFPDPFDNVERLRFDFNGDDFKGTYRFAGLVAF